jgi:hypothetical protein
MVLLRYRMLLIYPVLSTTVVAVVAGLLPLALVWARLSEEKAAFAFSVQGVIGFLILYFVTCITVQFFNVMLVAEANARFNGLRRAKPAGVFVAVSGIRSIVVYAALASSLVSLPILVVCRLARLVGVRSLPDPGAWSLATFLGVPILAVEHLGAREALHRSESLLRGTWGDRFIGGIGVFVVRILFVVASFVFGLGIVWLATLTNYDPLVLTTVVLWLTSFIFLVVTGSAVSMIYCLATYRHVTNQPIKGFEALHDLPGPELAT